MTPREVMNDFNVLPRRVKHLQHALIDHQLEEGREVEAGRELIDQHLGAVGGDLDQAEPRPEGLLAHEFGVDRDKGRAAQPRAGFGQLVITSDEVHGGRV